MMHWSSVFLSSGYIDSSSGAGSFLHWPIDVWSYWSASAKQQWHNCSTEHIITNVPGNWDQAKKGKLQMCTTKQAQETKTHLQECVMRRLWACNAHGYMVYECMYACTDYDLLIMYKCVNFCEIFIHSFSSQWCCLRHCRPCLPLVCELIQCCLHDKDASVQLHGAKVWSRQHSKTGHITLATLATITGTTILVPCPVVMKSNGAQFSNGLQRLDLKIGHQDSSPNNGHQDDMPYCRTR